MKNLSRKKLGVFISVVEAGNFTEGARCSNISQPAAISIINEIEATIGIELFERVGKTRRAKLTPRGQAVYETLMRGIATYDQMLEAIVSNRKPHVPKILIQTPYVPVISTSWLTDLVSGFSDCQLCIRSAERDEIFSVIESREECIAFIDGDTRPKNSEYFPLGSSETVLVVADSHASGLDISGSSITWDGLPRETIVYSGTAPDVTNRIYDNLRAAGTNRGELTEVNCAHILKHFVFGLGTPAIVPGIMANTLSNEGKLHQIQFTYSKVYVPFGLVLPYGYSSYFKFNRADVQKIFS
ncbi:LysR family transcriptional regulator [Brucella intermedia]|uniref:LysR family transcriptional regulator n=1 Tax=Brucella intermedia TaxID=94625 RepID=UPI0023622026|nr:LysR family transcriptional regulator [Brucella intermedia]